MSVSIDIAVDHKPWAALADLDALAQRAVDAAVATSDAEIPDGTEVSIVLCDDVFIQNLNKTWRGKDRPTNVLSFPTDEASLMLGDIVVAYETSAREAEEEEQTLDDYLSHLIVHGFFHLLGYDHETDEEADTMEALESRALKLLGIASPYEDAEAKP